MHRRSSRFVALPLAAPILALVLGACGAPTPAPVPEPYVARGVYVGDPSLLPMAAALLAPDVSVLPLDHDAASVADAGVAPLATELVPGWWVVGTAFVGTEGEVALELLDAEAMPTEALVAAGEAFRGGFGGSVPVGCTVAPTDPAARVTAFGLAGPVLTPVLYGFTSGGPEVLVITTTAVDLSDPALSAATFVAYVHADRPVRYATSGTCADATQTLTVAVDLEAGWNRVALRLSSLPAPGAVVVIEDDAGTGTVLQAIF